MDYKDKITDQQIASLLEEISSLKRENEKLKAVYDKAVISEKAFRDLFDSTSDAIYIQDNEGRFLMVNRGAELMYGYPREYFVGKTPEFLSAPGMNDLEKVIEYHKKAIKGIDQHFEFWGITKTKRIFPKTVKMMKGFYKNQDVVIVTAQDITDKKLTSESIKKTTTTLKALFDSTPDGIVIIENNDISMVNIRFTEITGLTLRDLKSRKLESIVNQNDIDRLKEILKTAEKTNKMPEDLIYKVKLDSGEEKILKNRYRFLGNDNDFKNRLVIVSDITEQQKNEEALQDSEFKLKGIFQNSLDGIGVSKNGVHVMCNPAYLQIFGYESNDELLSIKEIDLIAEDERERISEYTQKRIKNESAPTIYNTIGLKKDGSKFDLEIKVSEYFFKGEKYQIAFVRDITESNKLMSELIEAKNNAEKADNLKSEFLAQVSHEIRTPINAILSFAGLIKEEVNEFIDKEISESFDIMNRAGNRLIRTIDLILGMSELQTNSYEMNESEINLNKDIIENILIEKSKTASKKKIDIKTNFNDELIINADENSVYQIFENIIDNAVKYTDNGEIQINTRIENSIKTVEVIDTGIGISNEYLEKLFQPFTQEEQGYCRKFEGNGLGLALVKKYCEMNNAEIKVVSKKGLGTKFTVAFM
ncbi:MAG: PAS domain-containing sensor histidine kinase [Melioribacteraceae bacterium]|jgi:PAS domain S-box-containing protein|nr:PAS domain-containing sensor histidine kinase [Melioribacteraceae bacterium]